MKAVVVKGRALKYHMSHDMPRCKFLATLFGVGFSCLHHQARSTLPICTTNIQFSDRPLSLAHLFLFPCYKLCPREWHQGPPIPSTLAARFQGKSTGNYADICWLAGQNWPKMGDDGRISPGTLRCRNFETNQLTLWLFNVAMENGPLIDGLPIKHGWIFHGYVK